MEAIYAKGDKKTKQRLLTLRQEAQSEKQPRVFLRIQAVVMSMSGMTAPQIAKNLSVHRSRVSDWIRAWNQYDMEGLKEGHRSGRPVALNTQQQEHLFDIIDSGPVAYGLTTGVWTSPLISEVIRSEFSVGFHPGHVRKLLKKIGFSVQRPTTTLFHAVASEQNRWRRYTLPNLKKSLCRKRQYRPHRRSFFPPKPDSPRHLGTVKLAT